VKRKRKIGIYLHSFQKHIGGGEYEALVLAADLAADRQVEIVHHKPPGLAATLERFFSIDTSSIAFRYVEPPAFWPALMGSPIMPKGEMRRWLIELSSPYDVFVPFSHAIPPYCYSRVGILRVLFPMFDKQSSWPWGNSAGGGRIRSWARRWYYDRGWNDRMSRYQMTAANSEYTRRWTDRYWQTSSNVVYPPVDRAFQCRPKEKLLICVGRLGADKKQLEMARAFAQLSQLHAAGWRLCIVGAMTSEAVSQEYAAAIRDSSTGFPIDLHCNAGSEEVQSLFERASIFWHAKGMDVDSERDPGGVEHFGITTVEAMRAGCVPIVVNRGGQPEIVRQGIDGLLWNTVEELKQSTLKVASDPVRLANFASAARERSRKFSRDAFVAPFRKLIEQEM